MIWRTGDDNHEKGAAQERENPPQPQQGDPFVSEGEPAAPGHRSENRDRVGPRIDGIIDAAERAAAEIRADAEAQARRYLEEAKARADEAAARRISEMTRLTDNLIEHARQMARQSDELIDALEDGGRRLADATHTDSEEEIRRGPQAVEQPPPPPSSPPAAQRESPLPDAEPPSPPQPAQLRADSRGGNAGVSEGARLLATQMAVAGSSRAEIARRLQADFGIAEPGRILDEVGI